ncbi:Toluene efflux pump outer membrane protein TtgI (plasmid) [Asticcacaulis sp. MM231]|uniref:efflux transporter outer membrane subunit n=1 Tax=Asticcacaulis sp. MM231 TaxID=3157666 RepID=UPI0032D5AE4B
MLKFQILLPTLAVLAACSTPTARLPVAPSPVSWPVASDSAQLQAKAWWTQGADPILLDLIAAANHDSHNIRMAEARLKEARASHVTARSLLFPDISATGAEQRGDVGLTYNYKTIDITQGQLNASYDLDLFGGLKARSKAAGAAAKAAGASLDDVRGAVRLEIVATYIGLRQCQQDLESFRTMASAAHEISASYEQQWRKGLITQGQFRSSEIEARAADTGVSRLTEACEQYVNAISVLAGDDQMHLRERLLAMGAVPALRHPDTTDAPMSILRQRPDIQAAEANLTAARASTRSAQASLFPDLSITAFYGNQDTSVRSSFDVWNTAASVYWPLLNFGRIKSQIDMASAREVEAYEGYRLTAVAALADVRTKLSAVEQADRRQSLASADVQSSNRQHGEATQQYQVGLVPKIAYLASVIRNEQSRRALIDADAERSIRAAALYRAEGL